MIGRVPMRRDQHDRPHRTEGLLYIGKAKNLKDKLRTGQKVFF